MTSTGSIAIGDDLHVRRIGFGAMRITGAGVWGEPPDARRAVAVLRRAVELGVDFIDTADSYGPEVSERLIAEALYPYPAGLVIATKGGFLRSGPNQWAADGRPEHLREACEDSLRRLRLDAIDLYQMHVPDPAVPWEESIGALADLRVEGKIRHVGLCNVTQALIERAQAVVPIVSVQNKYSLLDRDAERVLRHCEREQIPFICWYPLQDGTLGKPSRGVQRAARDHEATPAQIALAWLLHRSEMTLPIPGTGSPDHVEENMGALGIRLSPDELAGLEKYRLRNAATVRRDIRRTGRRVARAMLLPLIKRLRSAA